MADFEEMTDLEDLLEGIYEKKDKTENIDEASEPVPEAYKTEPEQPRSAAIKRRSKAHHYRRAFSETQLLDLLGLEFEDGATYHVMTGGDVDSLSFLKVILRHQDLDYCLFSTWCIAMDDILQLEEWLEEGRIKKMDAYLGDLYLYSYRFEHRKLLPIIKRHGGKVVIFRNHSKVIAGHGPKFHFTIESSANINTNKRAENASITIDREVYGFYKKHFDSIIDLSKG